MVMPRPITHTEVDLFLESREPAVYDIDRWIDEQCERLDVHPLMVARVLLLRQTLALDALGGTAASLPQSSRAAG